MTDTLNQIPYFWPLAALVLGFAGSLAGGALGGILTGGKALGNELAAMMGAMYGPMAGVPGAALAVGVMILLGWGV